MVELFLWGTDVGLHWALQKMGMGTELSFLTSPAPGPSGTLKLLAIADHGHAEVSFLSPSSL